MQWAAVIAGLAFVVTTFLQVVSPDWRYRRPLARFALGGAQALLWLPVPIATGLISSSRWTDGYLWFTLWGMAGFAMQAMGFWLRVSHELTIQTATDKWLLLSDRRYWELQHKSVDGLSGDGMISVTQLLVQVWVAAFAIHLLSRTSGHPLYTLYAVVLLVLALACILHSVAWLIAQLSLNQKTLASRTVRLQAFFSGCAVFSLGLVTGWLLIMAGLFA